MSRKKFTLKENTSIEKCPQCGNNTEFVARSEQVAEDCCEIWIQCKCGHSFSDKYHLEDVWGSLGKDEILMALDCSWNEPINDQWLPAARSLSSSNP